MATVTVMAGGGALFVISRPEAESLVAMAHGAAAESKMDSSGSLRIALVEETQGTPPVSPQVATTPAPYDGPLCDCSREDLMCVMECVAGSRPWRESSRKKRPHPEKQPLDGRALSEVVSSSMPSLKRGCWGAALQARTANAPSKARVAVSLTIAASGLVENVFTSGDPAGYPGLAGCIQKSLRKWKFRRSTGTTTATFPVVFSVQ